MPQSVAFLGFGAMGAPMARNLAAAGFAVRGWNRTASRVTRVERLDPAASVAEACQGAEFVVSMLADDAAVNAVTYEAGGVLESLAPDAIHIGMSTVSVATTERLGRAHAEKGRGYIAAPVFGRPDAAEKKLLWIVPGGPDAALARAAPLFAAMGQGVFPMGTAGHAALAKLAGNFLIAATIESLGEAFVLAEKGGLEPAKLQEFLSSTLFASPIVKGYGARLVKQEFVPPGFTLRLGLKDVRLVLAAAEASAVPMPLAELVQDRLETAIERGRGEIDFAGMAIVIREEAGL